MGFNEWVTTPGTRLSYWQRDWGRFAFLVRQDDML